MRRTAEPVDDSLLFDLPLVAEPELVNKPRPKPTFEASVETSEAEQISLPEGEPEALAEPEAAHGERSQSIERLQRRWFAGALDAAVIGGTLGLMVAGAAALGIRPALSGWPSYAVLALVLSFVYSVFSLVFWGKTPGMRQAGLVAASRDGSAVTIGQALLRWLGGACTALLLGLPTLLDLHGGGTLTDRISGSRVASPADPDLGRAG